MAPFAPRCAKTCLVIALACVPFLRASGQFTFGNVVVLEVGTGGVFPMNGSAMVLREFAPDGTPVTVLNIPTTGTDAMVGAASTLGGGMSLTTAGDRLVFPGYVDFSAEGVGISTTSAQVIPRAVGTVDAAGNIVRVFTSSTLLSGASILSAASDGTNFWAGGAGGVAYFGPGPQTVVGIDTSVASHIAIAGGQLSKRGNNAVPEAHGIYDIGTGLPTTGGQPQTQVIDVSQVPSGFQFNAARDVCYVASFGVQKWTLNNNTWSLAYTLPISPPDLVQELCVDFSGSQPVIYGTTFAPTRLLKWTDTGVPSNAIQLASTLAIWQGIVLAPGTCTIGGPCDDGDAATTNDAWTADCTCAGEIISSVPSSPVLTTLLAWPDPVHGDELFLNRKVDAMVLDARGKVITTVHHTDRIAIAALLPGVYFVRTAEGSVLRFVRE